MNDQTPACFNCSNFTTRYVDNPVYVDGENRGWDGGIDQDRASGSLFVFLFLFNIKDVCGFV